MYSSSLDALFDVHGDLIEDLEDLEDEEEEEEEPGFMQAETVSFPWDFSRVVESPHPVKDNYKLR